MPYELTLRPQSTEPVCKDALRNQLIASGLQVHPNPITPGILHDGIALFEIIGNAEVMAGVSVLVKIPLGLEFCEVNIELLKLARLAGLIDAAMSNGHEVMINNGPASLDSLDAFCARYDRIAFEAAASTGVPCR